MPAKALDWGNLRCLNGSQQTAFEVLCCQLASHEQAPVGSRFTRKAPPDAGVECYWTLPSGQEWCWQAKFFRDSLSDVQWRQIDDSVLTALAKHPHLVKMTICVPADLADPRKTGELWGKDRWDQHVAKWRERASGRNTSVDFAYWGQHEVFERLSRNEHAGRVRFWFDEQTLSDGWFRSGVDVAISNAGHRYTPELRVDTPIAEVFDALGRTPSFDRKLGAFYDDTKLGVARSLRYHRQPWIVPGCAGLHQDLDSLLDRVLRLRESVVERTQLDGLTEEAGCLMDRVHLCSAALDEAVNEGPPEGPPSGTPHRERTEAIESERRFLLDVRDALQAIHEFLDGDLVAIANMQAVLVVGPAGCGKTHLLCDVARIRTDDNLPTVLLHGRHFRNGEPWKQLIEHLGLKCGRDEFLGALECAAEAKGRRALILIDALNESSDRSMWKDGLSGMLTVLASYPWIRLAISVRTTYEDTVLPEGLVPDRLRRVRHKGFAGCEFDAIRSFCGHYKLKMPSMPLLLPEFHNPLFLKLLCGELYALGRTEFPRGWSGIQEVFGLFLQGVDKRLSDPARLDFDPRADLVRKAVASLADLFLEEGRTWLERDKAKGVVDDLLPHRPFSSSLFKGLVDEGVLLEDRLNSQQTSVGGEYVRFSYERFADHMMARLLLDQHPDEKNPQGLFRLGTRLGDLLRDEQCLYEHSGIIEALAIQVPERFGKELVELAPHCKDSMDVQHAFVESIIWRNPKAFGDATTDYVNSHIIGSDRANSEFLDAWLSVATIEGHFFSADRLHSHLMSLSLHERDAWWSVFLHTAYEHRASPGTFTTVQRMVEWAWAEEDRTHISDEAMRLMAVVLGWFLTSSNRFLRDRATKAMVRILSPRLKVLQQILLQFDGVNDPYVSERLCAVAYGCAMRSRDNAGIAELAHLVYKQVFSGGKPVAHLLLRDYARGVIEVAYKRGCPLSFDIAKARPPYTSRWPDRIPSVKALQARIRKTPDGKTGGAGQWHLWESVMEYGDFARYIIGTNSGVFPWSSRKLGTPLKASRLEIREAFEAGLTKRQKQAWVRFAGLRNKVEIAHRMDADERRHRFGSAITDEQLDAVVLASEKAFRATLSGAKLKRYRTQVAPFLAKTDHRQDEHAFDLSLAQRWVLKRVLDLGWTPERFGEFDRRSNNGAYYGRDEHKPERIGKKYQWIAYHEFLAMVADNFEFRPDRYTAEKHPYDGPWQISHTRDIDPSCLLRRAQAKDSAPNTNTWWLTETYAGDWHSPVNDREWLTDTRDVPRVESLIQVVSPEDRAEWLTLQGFYAWRQPRELGVEREARPYRGVWCMLRSYIVRKKDLATLYNWGGKKDFWGRWMPEATDTYQILLGESFWATAYNGPNTRDDGHDEWTQGHRQELPRPVIVSCEEYTREGSTYDCSVDDTYTVHLPCKWIADHMQMEWKGEEGHFHDATGQLVALDPSVRSSGPGALLVKRDTFLEMLAQNDCGVLWTVLAEKQVHAPDDHGTRKEADWPGSLEISGICRLMSGGIQRKLSARLLTVGPKYTDIPIT